MYLYGIALDQYRSESLYRLPVKSWCAVQKNIFVFDSLFENRPHFGRFIFYETAGTAYVVGELAREKTLNNERAEKFKDHVLGQAALVEREVGADDDDRTAGIVDAFPEKILTEIAVLALEVVGKRFKSATAASQYSEDTGAAA